MKVTPVKTHAITPNTTSIYELLDKAILKLAEKSIVVITSKVVSICEGSVVPIDSIDKKSLIRKEADLFLPKEISKYGFSFTITNNTLIPVAGIDESNGNGYYILWPCDAQKTANQIREFLCKNYKCKHVGVIITDSTCQPLRRGTSGIFLAYSGFSPLKDYVGTKDLFDRHLNVTQANIAGGLAAAAVVTMGEGSESTPICIISEVSFVDFSDKNPTQQEIQEVIISPEEDLFEPFLSCVDWQKGKKLS